MKSLSDKKGKYFIGKVADFETRKGWFLGHFQDNHLLKTELVEVAWQKISNKKPISEDKHYHKNSLEINIVLSGWVKFVVNSKKVEVCSKEFFIIYPYTVVEEFEAGDDTELIVVRVPSLPDDKYLGEPKHI